MAFTGESYPMAVWRENRIGIVFEMESQWSCSATFAGREPNIATINECQPLAVWTQRRMARTNKGFLGRAALVGPGRVWLNTVPGQTVEIAWGNLYGNVGLGKSRHLNRHAISGAPQYFPPDLSCRSRSGGPLPRYQ